MVNRPGLWIFKDQTPCKNAFFAQALLGGLIKKNLYKRETHTQINPRNTKKGPTDTTTHGNGKKKQQKNLGMRQNTLGIHPNP